MNNFALIPASDFATLQSIAAIVTKTGFTKLSIEQAEFVMLKGFELGISPMQALDGINIVSGKPTVSPQLMLALINRSGELEDMKVETTDTSCTVSMTRKSRTPHIETFNMDDARKMALAGKDNWTKQPKTMMKWRAVAACARVVFPDVIQGVYTPEEMGAEVNVSDDGDMIVISKADSAPVPSQPQIPATTPPQPQPPPETVQHWAKNGGYDRINALMKKKKLTWEQIKSSIEPGKTLERLSDTTLDEKQVEARIEEIIRDSKPTYGGKSITYIQCALAHLGVDDVLDFTIKYSPAPVHERITAIGPVVQGERDIKLVDISTGAERSALFGNVSNYTIVGGPKLAAVNRAPILAPVVGAHRLWSGRENLEVKA